MQPTISFESVIQVLSKMKLRHPKDTMPVNFNWWELDVGLCHVQICGVWWEIFDNGEEIKMGRLNIDGEHLRTVYLTGRGLNAATIAHRLAQVVRGEEVDYDFSFNSEDARDLEMDSLSGDASCNFCNGPMPCNCPLPDESELDRYHDQDSDMRDLSDS